MKDILLALIDHLPNILSAVAGIVTAAGILVTGVLTWQNGKKVDGVKTQGDANMEKSEQIHVLVNGNMDKLKTDLAARTLRVEELERLLAERNIKGQ